MRVVVSGTMAEVFVDDGEWPPLVVSDLEHGEQPGTVALYARRCEFKGLQVRVADAGGEE